MTVIVVICCLVLTILIFAITSSSNLDCNFSMASSATLPPLATSSNNCLFSGSIKNFSDKVLPSTFNTSPTASLI